MQRHCLLPARWFEQWEAYVEASGGNQLPPPSLNNKVGYFKLLFGLQLYWVVLDLANQQVHRAATTLD